MKFMCVFLLFVIILWSNNGRTHKIILVCYGSKLGKPLHKSDLTTQWAESPKKRSAECIFDNMALYELTKNALLQTYFLVILPTGYKSPMNAMEQ